MGSLWDGLRRRLRASGGSRSVDAALVVELVAARRQRRLPVSCAWCGRYALGGQWVAAEQLPASLRREEVGASHGICPGCFDDLIRSGRSVAATASARWVSAGDRRTRPDRRTHAWPVAHDRRRVERRSPCAA